MSINSIEDALKSALSLLNQEIESVVVEELKEDYLEVIRKIELAIQNIEQS